MPKTNNLFGGIFISKRAIGQVVIMTVRECVGVSHVGKISRTEARRARRNKEEQLNTRNKDKVKIAVDGNSIIISVKVYLKFGVSIDPVLESIRHAIKYNVEKFTGMTVTVVNVDILGIGN